MKKLPIDPRFWLTAAFCAALLAAPPLLRCLEKAGYTRS